MFDLAHPDVLADLVDQEGLRFHIVQNLAREKCYFSAFLFLKASSYRRLKPFSDVFGVTSRLVLTQQPSLDELAALPVEDLAMQLHEMSGHHLRDLVFELNCFVKDWKCSHSWTRTATS